MPHISKKKLDTQITNELRKHLYTLVRNSGSQTRVLIFEELLTKTETIMLAKRIGALLLLKRGLSLYKISRLLGVSPSTVERFKLAWNRVNIKIRLIGFGKIVKRDHLMFC